MYYDAFPFRISPCSDGSAKLKLRLRKTTISITNQADRGEFLALCLGFSPGFNRLRTELFFQVLARVLLPPNLVLTAFSMHTRS